MGEELLDYNLRKLNKIRQRAGLSPIEVDVKLGKPGHMTAIIEAKEEPEEVTDLVPVEQPTRVITAQQLGEALLDIRDSMKMQESEGDIDAEELTVTEDIQEKGFKHPVTGKHVELMTMNIYNHGDSDAHFMINYPNARVITLQKKELIEMDFAKSKRKIQRIFYYTDPDGSATARVVGKF